MIFKGQVDVDGYPGLVFELLSGGHAFEYFGNEPKDGEYEGKVKKFAKYILDPSLSFALPDNDSRDILHGLEYIHGVGIVHRDIR